MSTCVTDSISLVSDSNNNTINTNSFKERPESEKNSDSDEYGNACALNDNSKPQQGTGEKRVAPQRSTPLIPPFVKDSRKLFVGGLPSDGTFIVCECRWFASMFVSAFEPALVSAFAYARVFSPLHQIRQTALHLTCPCVLR